MPSTAIPAKSSSEGKPAITIASRTTVLDNAASAEVFTMSLGAETIDLVPFKSWGQLDAFKWTVRGKLPGTPPGLEITPEHLKIAGETVVVSDPSACPKLQTLFNQWLALENQNFELSRKKAQVRPPAAQASSGSHAGPEPLRFRVEVDKRGQVHISCVQGKETVTSIGLSIPGLNGLASQGLMRKPRALEVGALHDWIELDGELCSFEHGNNDAAKLERLLNEHYRPHASIGQGKDILVFSNPASPTGFDIQFPVTLGGVQENRRRTFNDAALELLQEPVRCGLLQPGLIIKISPPNLIIKRKTTDGGETYLAKAPENTVTLSGEAGGERLVDLSRPVNYTRLSVVEMAAILNHPCINRHSKNPVSSETPAVPDETKNPAEARPVTPAEPLTLATAPGVPQPETTLDRSIPEPPVQPKAVPKVVPPAASPGPARTGLAEPAYSLNAWLKEVLQQSPIRHDWLTCLLYRKIAEYFGNSSEADLKLGRCWRVLLQENAETSGSQVVFLTRKGGLGFLGGGRLARFHRGVLFIGSEESVLEGIDVHLVGVGLWKSQQIVFIIRDPFQSRFGVSEETVSHELKALNEAGAWLVSVSELLASAEPLHVVWTVPAEQAEPNNPQACEHLPPNAQLQPDVAQTSGLL